MFFYIRKKTKELVLRSRGQIEFDSDKLEEIDFEPSKEEMQKLEENWPALLDNGKLIFDKPSWFEENKKKTDTRKLEEIKEQLSKNSSPETVASAIAAICDIIKT